MGDSTIDASCSTADGAAWSLRVAVTNASSGAITGTLEVTPDGSGQPAPTGAPASGGSSG